MSIPTPAINENQPGSVADDFPPDPLLASGAFISSTTPTVSGTLDASGAFISSTTPTVSGTLDNSAKRRPIQGGNEVSVSGESGRIGMSDGTDQVNPAPEISPQTETKSRKRTAPPDNWLPLGWRVEDKVRTSGATAGTVDKYYYEPVTGRKFRSRTEVLYYLEHGTSKKGSKKAENADFQSDRSEGQGSQRASKKAKQPQQPPPPPLNFDFENPPEKVSWSMGNTGEEAWTPFIGDEKVQDSLRQDWSTAFTIITTQNPSKLSF